MDKNKKRKTDTKQKLLEAAIDLIAKKGYDSVSIREITRKVGVKESALYNYFKSKEELFNSIFEIFIEEVGKTTFPIEKVREGLNNMDLSAYLQYQAMIFKEKLTPTMGKIWRIIFMEQYRDERARSFVLDDIMTRPEAFYKRVFEVASEKGMIKTKSPEMLAKVYQNTLLSLSWQQLLRGLNGEDVSSINEQRVEIINFIVKELEK